MPKTLFTLAFILFATLSYAQDDIVFLQDSIYCDQGINGTLEFEPQTRILFPEHDERGRPLEEIRERRSNSGVWRPQTRRLLNYEGDNLTELLIQVWDMDSETWQDQRKDSYTYVDDLLRENLRQRALKGALVNYRRWLYDYNEDGLESLVLLQQWTGSEWENLSRKSLEYNQNNDLSRQLLQVWMNGEWRNVRVRDWEYEAAGGGRARVKTTTVRVWSVALGDWVNQLRKIFNYNDDGIWISSRFEDWVPATEEWVNTDRMVYRYNAQNQPIGQFLQRWDGADWVNRGQANFVFQDNQFLSRIETWDAVSEEWTNFLRYRASLDDRNLLQSRVGMQAWDEDQMRWENREFTQRYTYYWTEAIVNSVKEAEVFSACIVPNPYPVGSYFFCDLPPSRRPYQLELYDMLGRPVYRQNIQSGQAVAINQEPAAGVYVLRIRDGQQLYHLQRIVIH